VSLEYAVMLRRRAEQFLSSASTNLELGNYDVTCVEAEIAAQLLLKSAIVALGYEVPRTHNVRELIWFLALNMPSKYGDLVTRIKNFVREFKRELMILEDCRRLGQYGGFLIDRDRAEVAVDVAGKVKELSSVVWRVIRGGGIRSRED